jgi:hypothetical protein
MKDNSRLVHADTGEEIKIGAKLKSSHDSEAEFTVTGWRAPHKASSTGRVCVTSSGGFDREFFPSVFGLKIVDHPFER